MEKHSSDSSISSISSIWAYLTSVSTAIFGGLTLQDVALWVGIITTIGTFAVNWYYKEREHVREDEREERRHGGK